MNPDDVKRDQIIRYLYQHHKSTRGMSTIPVGIQQLQREMKERHKMKQNEVSSNLDYLVQAGWVVEDIKDRTFTTDKGMKIPREQVKYKISYVGIDHLEAGTMFKKPETASHVNITNIEGVTVVGDGNVVNTQFTDLFRAIEELDQAIAHSNDMSPVQKLEAIGDLSTIRTQIAKKNPNRSVIKLAWKSLKGMATVSSVAEALGKVGGMIKELLL